MGTLLVIGALAFFTFCLWADHDDKVHPENRPRGHDDTTDVGGWGSQP